MVENLREIEIYSLLEEIKRSEMEHLNHFYLGIAMRALTIDTESTQNNRVSKIRECTMTNNH